MIKRQPKCKCGKFLANFGRTHADGSEACDIWRRINQTNGVQIIAPGKYDVYSDGDGHYAVMGEDRKIMFYEMARDYACMKAIELNRKATA